MLCIQCRNKTNVKETREDKVTTYRRRYCPYCDFTFRTKEVEWDGPMPDPNRSKPRNRKKKTVNDVAADFVSKLKMPSPLKQPEISFAELKRKQHLEHKARVRDLLNRENERMYDDYD